MTPNALTPTQEAVLRAVMNRIVPADEFPSAWEAGAGGYVLRQFAGAVNSQVDAVAAGLDALEAEAQSSHGSGFAALEAAQQDGLLGRLERKQLDTVWPVDPAVFLETLIMLTMEGYYADPGNGGNREAVSWRMIGFTGQP
ncbi:MAG: gluconate 2-dehydrogenase subunit 3 family protein [Anaerolineales bacterium]|nr:gluconate 2-dehydrogenase subunit 3 family protein [Anaerolineales bacterium]